jgi:NAD(P)-dependent dehydrogenase (short-subunit alcohol dehydrogenase family)
MAIEPGIFLTPMPGSFPQNVQDALWPGAAFRRLGEPPEFSRLLKGSLRNPMRNGEVIRLDAAIRMAPR